MAPPSKPGENRPLPDPRRPFDHEGMNLCVLLEDLTHAAAGVKRILEEHYPELRIVDRNSRAFPFCHSWSTVPHAKLLYMLHASGGMRSPQILDALGAYPERTILGLIKRLVERNVLVYDKTFRGYKVNRAFVVEPGRDYTGAPHETTAPAAKGRLVSE